MKINQRIISILLLLLLIISIIPQTAFASEIVPVDAKASAGGSGKAPGSSKPGGNSGKWYRDLQGLRISVLGYDGTPAFTFTGKNSLDLVFGYRRLNEMFIYGDTTKLGLIRNIVINENSSSDVRNKLNTKIMSMADIKTGLDNNTFATAVPSGVDKSKSISKLNSIPYPLSTIGSGTNMEWVTYGNELRSSFYGSADTLDKESLLYVILNLSLQNSGKSIPLWQPKLDALVPDGGFTSEELAQFAAGDLSPINLMANKGLIVSIEPIIWNDLRISKSQFSSLSVYGTQTDIGWITNWLEEGGYFRPAGGKGAGGWDTSLFGRMGRRSMVTKDLGFKFNYIRDIDNNIIPYEWVLMPPVDTKQIITNKEVMNVTPGWSLHLYRLGSEITETYITTRDPNTTDEEHPAPDPSKIPLQSGEKQTDRTINIVKTYEDNSIHVVTKVRSNTPKKIVINDEPNYKVTEWFISDDFVNPPESMNWGEIKSNASVTLSGNSTNFVSVEKPDTTLYVKLERKGPAPVGGGDLVITESQITKAADTIDPNILGWGPKTAQFGYTSISGTCGYTWYCSSDDCSGHTCGAAYALKDTGWSYHFKNEKTIVEDIQANVGVFKALNTRGADASGNRTTLSAGTDSVNSFNYQLVLWRGRDIPTLASYKVTSGHELNTLLNKHGKQPVGTRLNSNYTKAISISLVKNGALGDYYTDSEHHTGYGKSSTATMNNKLDYNSAVEVEVYSGVKHDLGNIKNTNAASLLANLVGKTVTPKFSGGTAIDSSTPLTFYPYIRMTYQKPAMTFNDRIDVNVLSQWISELHPHSYAEASWGSTKDINVNISSVQWSTHKRAIEGTDGWQGKNKVLPGGAVFTLDTKNQNTYASVITWQPYLENEIANKVIISGAGSYKLADTSKPHNDLVDSAKKALDNWRIVQYVEKNTNASDAFGGLKITGGGESLTTLGLTNKSSTEAKYYLKTDGVGEVSGQGDLDIINTTVTEIHYKVKADTQGNVYVQRNRDGSGWVTIDTISKNKKVSDLSSILSNESKQLDERTKIITNVLTVLTRNVGDDKSASWATSDGKWYNEAFDGINYIRQETCFEVGFADSPLRSAAIDTRLTPPNTGQGDLFSKAFISQFRLNDKSDAYTSEVAGYVGKFKGQVVKLHGADNMYKTRVFAIPNANVQDLK